MNRCFLACLIRLMIASMCMALVLSDANAQSRPKPKYAGRIVLPNMPEELKQFGATNSSEARLMMEVFLNTVEKQIEKSPDDSKWHMTRAATLVRLRRLDEAIESADRAIEIDPRAPKAWLWRGTAQSGLKKYRAAIESLQKAKACGHDDSIFRSIAICHSQLGE